MAAFALLASSGCGVNSAKKHYVQAEKLWSEGAYPAAVAEFEKVTAKDVQRVAGDLFRNGSLAATVLGNVNGLELSQSRLSLD